MEQRESLHATGFWPSPSPQQNRPFGWPFCLPLQSLGHDTQSSPSPASQMPLPQLAPLPLEQSAGQDAQSSPDSQIPLPQHSVSGSPGTHWPVAASQVSSPLQALPSSQSIAVDWQPVVGSHESVVQAKPSLQVNGVPETHWPVPRSHVSAPLQISASSHSESDEHAVSPSKQVRESRNAMISGIVNVPWNRFAQVMYEFIVLLLHEQ